jgi:hypothetical protein
MRAFTFSRYFQSESEGILPLYLKDKEEFIISSKIKGNFKLDGNVLEIALRLYSALRFERIHFYKNQGQ